MNAVDLFLQHAQNTPEAPALWFPRKGVTTFAELKQQAAGVQRLCLDRGLKPGDAVLLVDGLSPRLYATVIGLLGLGCPVLLVEPWMPIAQIDHAVKAVEPKLFLTNWIGRLWGLRAGSVRQVPKWVSVASKLSKAETFQLEAPASEVPGIITFTSGTTGKPKGVVRQQGYLFEQHRVIANALHTDRHTGPDVCIFANFALTNLASGRCSLVIPSRWKTRDLKELDRLPVNLQPETLTCGPAFLQRLMESANVPTLQAIHVGGALTDCALFERAFARWPHAEWTHVYGGSEVEPVTLADAKKAVAKSRAAGFIQTVYIGNPIPEIRHQFDHETVWVAGPHVCPLYVGNDEANRENKRTDEEGTIWHRMGDRIHANEHGWWYHGRSGQPEEDFLLEQKIYRHLNSSHALLHRTPKELVLIGESLPPEPSLREAFPQVNRVIAGKIYRDRRHRARIDRKKTVSKAYRP